MAGDHERGHDGSYSDEVLMRRFDMRSRIFGLTTSALILTYSTVGALAQNQATPQPDPPHMQSHSMDHEDTGTMGPGRMMGRGMMGGGMMGSTFMMRMMFALMDADGDGTISLQEFQAAHERIFKGMDSNKDGKLTPEEMHAFIHGAM
jgi:hypothetical protein